MIRLSIIIPAHNEEVRLPATLRKINAYLQNQDYLYEILVIDDGSTDKTGKIVKGLIGEVKNLKLIGYQKNKGKGYAVRIGMLRAEGNYRLFVDADNSTSIEQIEKFWPELEGEADIVIASRDIKGAILNPSQNWWRKFVLGGVYKKARKIMLNLQDIEDTQCGFKKEAAEKIFPCCQINGFAFDVEVLVLARKMGFSIKEVPVYWRNSSLSKVTIKSMIKIALDLVKIKKRYFFSFKKRD